MQIEKTADHAHDTTTYTIRILSKSLEKNLRNITRKKWIARFWAGLFISNHLLAQLYKKNTRNINS